MQTFSIGFTQKSAERFFGLLHEQAITRLLDVRLNNVSQLAGFAKKDDLRFFLRELCQAEYLPVPELVPTASLLKAYQNKAMPWDDYALRFTDLLVQRQVDKVLDPKMFDRACLLCSEHEPHFCHRRIALDYLNTEWQSALTIRHLT